MGVKSFWYDIANWRRDRAERKAERRTLKILATDSPTRGQWWTNVEIVDASGGKLSLADVDGATFELRQRGHAESKTILDGYSEPGYEGIERYVWKITELGREEIK